MWQHTTATTASLYQCRAEMRADTSSSSDVSKELPVRCAAPEEEVTKRKSVWTTWSKTVAGIVNKMPTWYMCFLKMCLCCKLYGSFTHSERISFLMSIVPKRRLITLRKTFQIHYVSARLSPRDKCPTFETKKRNSSFAWAWAEIRMKPGRLLKHRPQTRITKW